MMAGTGVIDDYVTTLARTLRGPGRLRRDMVAEARDGLEDAAAAYRAEGTDPVAAERMAVAEFGPIAEVAPGYQEELAASVGRRTAAMMFLTVPVITVLWTMVWHVYPELPPPTYEGKPSWFMPLARFLDFVQFAMGLLGAAALLLLSRKWRGVRRPETLTRALGALLWIQAPVIFLMSAALTVGAGSALDGFHRYTPGLVLTIATTLSHVWLLYAATRCLITTRGATTPLPARRRILG
ncbi:permease prefix domain 1-containing protein [Sphaerisporangium aureirubrum]|uniref:Permease prefix domain 1-containing protein n=1 Tax=Sphaerisporangium aureirubrum TaxID=1544736 RepID=A0ABW1NBZ6_9ACTN